MILTPAQSPECVIERDIQRVETLIKGEKRDTPVATLKAIHRAFKAIDQERRQMQKEELRRA